MKSKELNKVENKSALTKQVFVQRIFSLRNKSDKEIRKVILTIYQPVKSANAWSCSYQITEFQNNALYSILGIDALQSFELALNIIDGLLKTHNKNHDNQIVWLKKGFELIKENIDR